MAENQSSNVGSSDVSTTGNSESTNPNNATNKKERKFTDNEKKFGTIFGYSPEVTGEHFGPTYKHGNDEYGLGNSIFHLVTYINKNKAASPVRCTGILNEMPEFSFSVKYESGPGKTMQDLITKLFDNDLFNITNAIGTSSNFKNLLPVGALSNDQYDGVDISDITLKFRIYAQDSLGQTDTETWLDFLSRYAVPTADNQINANRGVTNMLAAVKNASGIGGDLIKIFADYEEQDDQTTENSQQNSVPDAGGSDDPATQRHKTACILNVIRQIQAALNQTSRVFSSNFIKSLKDTTNEKFKNNADFIELINDLTGSDSDYHLRLFLNEITRDKKFKLVATWSVPTLGRNNEIEKSDEIDISSDTGNMFFQVTENDGDVTVKPSQEFNKLFDTIKTKVHNEYEIFFKNIDDVASSYSPLVEKVDELFDNCKREAMNCAYPKTPTENTEDTNSAAQQNIQQTDKWLKSASRFLDTVGKNADKIQKIGEQRFSYHRAAGSFNRSNSLGEKLFELYIYDKFLFKKFTPLTVYIKDWSCKYSNELLDNRSAYCDFEITCGLDQVYSVDQWDTIFRGSMSSAT